MGNSRKFRRNLTIVPAMNGSVVAVDTRPGAAAVENFDTSDVGAINGYRCDACHKYIFVIHKDKGVTPMFLACRATEGCEGNSVSLGYPAERGNPMPPHLQEKIQWKWVRPTQKEWEEMDDAMKDHIMRGGLELRRKEIDGPEGD